MRPVRLWIKYLHVVLTHKLRSKTRIIHETDYYCTPRGRIIGKFWEKWKLCCAKKSNVLDELKQAEKLRSRKMKKVGWKMKVESWRLKVEGWGLRVEGWMMMGEGWMMMGEGGGDVEKLILRGLGGFADRLTN